MSLPVYTIDIYNSKRMPSYVLLEKNGEHYKQLDIFFDTKEQAKHFAKKKGLKLATSRYMSNTGHSYNLSRKDIENSIFEGDCLEVLKRFPNNSIDMVLCDLPYGTTHNKWDSVIDLDKLWFEYNRVVKPNGAIVLTSQGIFTAKLILSNEKFFKYKLSWEKSKPTNFLNAKKQPLRKHEDVCIFYRKQPIYNPQMKLGMPYDKGIRKDQLSGSYGNFKPQHIKSSGERYPTDVVYFKTAESEGKVWHPTQKPIELARYLVRTYTNPSDIVLDNSFGSGSFLISAVLEGRFFCGIEKNEDVHLFKKDAIDYIEVANERLNNIGENINIKLYR
ncbi:DNA-methyltransferase [Rickettsia endosymbiont of Orchestes rusci]|uniref:DNA-methyltransferase n=1 Tax=Rickettsia endosymbiont of Orchestes rusci TaxID=3066250 RepID=UPI00313D0388